jgi:hypothetical protein
MSHIEKKSMEEKIDLYLDNFEKLLESNEIDHSKISKLMDEMLKVITVLMRTSAKLDKHISMEREVEIWARVHDVKGTYNSKTVLVLTCLSGALSIASGVIGLASAVPGTSLGNSLAGGRLSFLSGTAQDQGARLHNMSNATNQFAQGIGLAPKIFDEVNQSERVVANAWLEEEKQKRQDRKESHQKHVQQQERTIQHAREAEEKEHRAMQELVRQM